VDLDILPITLDQQKLISNAMRIKIMHLLFETPRTAKQVADLLGESPGNVHYHVQKLLNGNLVDLVETREVGGIVEKYYKSKGTRFRLIDKPNQTTEEASLRSRLMLTNKQLEQLVSELEEVLHKWERRTAECREDDTHEFELSVHAYRSDDDLP